MGRSTTTKHGKTNRIAENGIPKKNMMTKKLISNHIRKREAKYQQKMGCQNTTENGMPNHNRKRDAKLQQKTGYQTTTEKGIPNHNR